MDLHTLLQVLYYMPLKKKKSAVTLSHADGCIRGNSGLSVLLKDTLTCRLEEARTETLTLLLHGKK